MSNALQDGLEKIGYRIAAFDAKGDTISGLYEDRINRKMIADVSIETYRSLAELTLTREQAYRKGRNTVAGIGAVAAALALAGGLAYMEATGRTDIVHVISDGTVVDFGEGKTSSISPEVPMQQLSPTAIPEPVRL